MIHEEAAASYPFSQLGSGDALPVMVLGPLKPSEMKLTGWIAGDAAAELLKKAGLTLAELKERARKPSFRAFPLKEASLSASGEIKATPFVSRNVIARLPGATRPNEYILYGAHWDANGKNGADKTGDEIRNGAVDNATGTAEVLEIARTFKAGKAPARTIIFAAWTAEEKGLLGSEFYAAHPIYPLAKTAAVINLDPHVVLPAARDVELIGGGRTTLEDDFARVAKEQDLQSHAGAEPGSGLVFSLRSFSLREARRAGAGLPGRSRPGGRRDMRPGKRSSAAFNANCYHQPCDQFDPAWTFAGTVQEASVAFALGSELADSDAWPSWNPKSEYKAIRDETAAERAK